MRCGEGVDKGGGDGDGVVMVWGEGDVDGGAV